MIDNEHPSADYADAALDNTPMGGASEFEDGREAPHAAPRALSTASPSGAGTGEKLPPLPNYLRGLVNAGAFDESELRAIPHRRARIRFQGERGPEVARPLAHLAPDALATIKRLTGGGHVVGVLEYGNDQLNFALEIEREAGAPDDADPRVTALERAVNALVNKLQEPSELDSLGRVLVSQAIKRATAPSDAYGEIDRVIDSVGKLLGAGQKINAMRAKLAPVQEAAVEAAEGKPGAIQRLLDRLVTPERIDSVVESVQEWALRKAGVGTVDAEYEVSPDAGAGEGGASAD